MAGTATAVPFATAEDSVSIADHYHDVTHAHHGHGTEKHGKADKHNKAAQEKHHQAVKQTLALTEAMADYRRADHSNRGQHLKQMLALAEERQAVLAELVQSDPAAAVELLLTAKDRQGIPAQVQALLEQQHVVKGELEVFYEDYQDHSQSRLRHVLTTDNGRTELHMPNTAKAHQIQSGSKVRARGWQLNNTEQQSGSLVLEDEQNALSVLSQDSTTTTDTSTSTTAALTNTLGEQRTLVLLVNFQDNAQQPWTLDEVRDMVFGKVNDFYQENSNGQTWLSGDVHGYNTLPMDSTTCDSSGIDRYARQYAQEDGIDLSRYNRLIYLFPKVSSCGWTGKGTLGGTQSRAWINGSFTLNTIGHELGHNFGLHHAEKLDCGADTIGDNCISVTYGDTMDIMGAAGVEGHFGAYNKERLGWLTPGSGEIITADTEGSYVLEPYESASEGAVKGLKIKRGTDPVTGQASWYYLEYRQAIGFDSFLQGKDGITNGVVFRVASESDTQGSQLLDMTPSSSWADMDDAALAVGNSYTDPDAGVTITTEWANSTGASVHVSFAEQTCSQTDPVIRLASGETFTGVAGDTVSYNVTVTNNDNDGCAASDFDVAASAPAGWTATGATLNLAPGSSETTTLNITSSGTATDGQYDIAISAINRADSNFRASTVASYVVETPIEACVLANPVMSFTANQSGEVAAGTTVSYTATVTSQDSSTCEPSAFDVVASVPEGWSADSGSIILAPGKTASVSLNVTSSQTAAEGVYAINVYSYNTTDMSYNSNAAGTYAVAAPAPVCVAEAPLLSVSSLAGEVAAGSRLDYSVTVTNRDSQDCADKDIAIFSQLPAGWSGTSSKVTLAPGESRTVSISVTSATTAAEGSYSIAINAQDMAESNLLSQKVVNYVIITPVNNAPVAVNDSVTLAAKEPVQIDVLMNDRDPEGDALRIVAATQGAKGSVQITADGQIRYTPAKSFKTSDSFSYTISDGDKTATATVSISLSSSGSGGGNKGNGKK
ncbi:Ig-like domain-containing protein [Vibrio sp. CAU 1672]|uniref:Ig-like domain-containing protein n=1 Tax=Vibrio sp. CAU 1672 TaxID=3032594 RepID=UPI0023DC2BCC|nr:Ig-like domain-containing protein [Vibrio sp. CAU 1672]MDF2153421.1 Ig-like domain-containing protein [Vibrio sp. CAU 1672]